MTVARLHGLSQVPEQGPPSAGELPSETHQGSQLVLLHSHPPLVPTLLDEGAHARHILPAEEHEGARRQPVPAGSADLLVVALEMLRQVPVHDEPDVGLVDPHPEGDRGHHDLDPVKNERFLDRVALLRRQTGVIGARGDAAGAQIGGQIVRAPAGGTVDDASLALGSALRTEPPRMPRRDAQAGRRRVPVSRQKTLKLSVRVVLVDHLQPDVGPVEAGDEAGRPFQAQLASDVVAGVRVGRSRERDQRRPGQTLPQPAQLHVFGPEVVPPLRDAVRLVYRYKRDACEA